MEEDAVLGFDIAEPCSLEREGSDTIKRNGIQYDFLFNSQSVLQMPLVLAKDPDSLKSHPSPFHQLKQLKLTQPMGRYRYRDYFWNRQCSSVTLPLDVISYLTQGSLSGGTLVVAPEVVINQPLVLIPEIVIDFLPIYVHACSNLN
ncbi:hypothetical protein RHMOL_Rhmol11G0124400 [Rhododendron molle]|uniref:Uncharacterized protein n=1 Tax=Rhododendron molle TaxID=49168 RepID=A0ACC0LRH4_RHOML|nr:hypothetical protein RHMOL_Rhmol11G0124400 [Rhododendron molle]